MLQTIIILYILGFIISFSISIGYYSITEPNGIKKFFWKDYLKHILVISLLSWVFIGIIIGETRGKLEK